VGGSRVAGLWRDVIKTVVVVERIRIVVAHIHQDGKPLCDERSEEQGEERSEEQGGCERSEGEIYFT